MYVTALGVMKEVLVRVVILASRARQMVEMEATRRNARHVPANVRICEMRAGREEGGRLVLRVEGGVRRWRAMSSKSSGGRERIEGGADDMAQWKGWVGVGEGCEEKWRLWNQSCRSDFGMED